MIYKISQTEIKNKSWYIHDFFEPESNNASSTSPFNATIIGYFDILTFSLVTVLAFHKDVPSIRISKLYTCVLFIIFFSVSKLKSDLIEKIFIQNQQAIKTNQSTHGIVTVCPMKCLPLKIGVYIFFLC